MIASAYSIDLYCDHPAHNRSNMPWPMQYAHESKAKAWSFVRKGKWKVDRERGVAICRFCWKPGMKLSEFESI